MAVSLVNNFSFITTLGLVDNCKVLAAHARRDRTMIRQEDARFRGAGTGHNSIAGVLRIRFSRSLNVACMQLYMLTLTFVLLNYFKL
jgi:hypothetical protein